MSESTTHKTLKGKAVGDTGKVEVKLPSGKRIDVVTKGRAYEIERSDSIKSLKSAAKRLKESGKAQKVLQVPQKNFSTAQKAMKEVGITGTIKNLSGTKRVFVGAKAIKSGHTSKSN